MFDLTNFSIKKFIDHVMKKMKLDKTPEPRKTQLEKEIAETLADRIISTITGAMSAENLLQFEYLRSENPDLKTYEVLVLMAQEIPALGEILEKNINDLVEELTFDADRVDAIFKA